MFLLSLRHPRFESGRNENGTKESLTVCSIAGRRNRRMLLCRISLVMAFPNDRFENIGLWGSAFCYILYNLLWVCLLDDNIMEGGESGFDDAD